jgi:transcriptional regulator with XRE-family HTH domain
MWYLGCKRLLRAASVDDEPQRIIRTIRRALGMTKAEFARALGWAPSTISRWESGRAKPSNLALKIILAYGEERHVRYRPASTATTALPALLPRSPLPPWVAAGQRPVRPVSEVLPVSVETSATEPRPAWTRPRWEAELNLRVALGGASRGIQPSQRHWLRRGAVVGAALAVAVAVASPLMTRTPSPSSTSVPPRRMPPAAAEVRAVEPAAENDPAPPAAVPIPPRPVPRMAELLGVTLLGGVRQAMFRTPTGTFAVEEGDRLGPCSAARITADGVELRDPAGEVHTVALGGRIPID